MNTEFLLKQRVKSYRNFNLTTSLTLGPRWSRVCTIICGRGSPHDVRKYGIRRHTVKQRYVNLVHSNDLVPGERDTDNTAGVSGEKLDKRRTARQEVIC